MKVAIVGSRSVGAEHYEELCAKVPIGASTIISGGSKGADQLAKRYAEENNLFYEEFLPDYARFGRAAPLKRDQQIVERADYVIVMWNGQSRGAAYVIKYCLEVNTAVRTIICH